MPTKIPITVKVRADIKVFIDGLRDSKLTALPEYGGYLNIGYSTNYRLDR
jgi:hypothetical protein